MSLSKQAQLNKYKRLATGMLLLMAVIYLITELFINPKYAWVGYVQAFAEAAMVGALADWFAVTALFRHPMGLPIPHTNLIENSKNRIGDNLGNFVTENFLTAATIRPRIEQIQVAKVLGGWLKRTENRTKVIEEIILIIRQAVDTMDNEQVEAILRKQAQSLIEKVPLPLVASNALEAVVRNNVHQNWITTLAAGLRDFVLHNKKMVRDKVKEESHFLIPGFVDNILATKISRAAIQYFDELSENDDHYLRKDITQQLLVLAEKMKVEERWENDFHLLREKVLGEEQMNKMVKMIWSYLKQTLQEDLLKTESALSQYLDKLLGDMAQELEENVDRQKGIDNFVQTQAYRLIMKHKLQVSTLISGTVGNWKGRDLSDKLELEVGKDLQFIRINGTLVGGLVGLLIYIITQFIH